jgi:hypothetical protein
MGKKNDKRLCWNCDGYIEFEFEKCPYCGCNLNQPPSQAHKSSLDESVLNPPYPAISKEFAVTKEEWDQALDESGEEKRPEEKGYRNDLVAMIMLLPGVMFILFALALFLFSSEGVLQLQWKASFAYFYLMGAIPLLVFGFRSLR